MLERAAALLQMEAHGTSAFDEHSELDVPGLMDTVVYENSLPATAPRAGESALHEGVHESRSLWTARPLDRAAALLQPKTRGASLLEEHR